MSIMEFARTPMGRRFFEATLPKLGEELGHLNTNLQQIATALQVLSSRPTAEHGSASAGEASLEPVLAQLARAHLPIDAVESETGGLGLHETIASALGIVLRAASQAGVAATLRALRTEARDDAATPG